MSSRTVAVVLTAQVQNYVEQMKAAERHTTDVEKAARSATEQFRRHNEALGQLGAGFAAVGATAAVGLGLAIKASTEYGAKLAQLQSLSHASQQDMARLSDAAMTQGRAFGQSATQVAEAEIELTKAGRDASQILGGDLKGALALAAAGQIDVAKATQIGVTALTQFSASGATIPQVADALAAGADKALGSVEDLGMALNQGGLVASQMGLDLNDTVGTLSAFAQAGLIGSDAGTSFKTMLLSLQSPSEQAAKYLREYNITAYDTQGQFVGIANLAGQLQDAFHGVSQEQRDAALSTIFGTDAIRAANVLYTEGAKGIQGWAAAVDDTGFASAQAAGKMNSLQGDLTKLSAAFETGLVKAGSSADGQLRGIVQTATAVVEGLSAVPAPVMTITVALTAGVAAVGLLGGAALVAVPKIVAFRQSLAELGVTGRQAAGIFGKGSALLLGLTAVAGGFAALAQAGTASEQQITLAGTSIDKKWRGINDLFKGDGGFLLNGGFEKALAGEQAGGAGSAKFLDGLTFGLTHFSDVYKTNEGQFDALGQQLAGLAQQDFGRAQESFAGLVSKFKLTGDETQRLLALMPAYRSEIIKQADAAGVSATEHNVNAIAQGKGAVAAQVLAHAQEEARKSAEAQAQGVADLSGQARGAVENLDDLEKAIEGFGSATLNARGAQRKLQEAIDDGTKTIRENAGAHGNATEAGRKNEDALDAIASSAVDAAAKTLTLTHSTKDAAEQLRIGRAAFIRAAEAAGYSRDQAKKLADQLGLIPGNVTTAVGFTGYEGTIEKIRTIQAELAQVKNKSITVTVDQQGAPTAAYSDARESRPSRAGGGDLDMAPGPKGVDSMYFKGARGEHVFTATEVDRLGGQAATYRFRAALRAGKVPSLANGGGVSDGIAYQENVRAEAAGQAQFDAKRIRDAQKKATAARKAADRAQTKYEAIGSGKKDKAAKARAKAAAEAADKRADAAEKAVETERDFRDKALQARADANQATVELRNDREDFVSTQRRATADSPIDPLSYVDQARSMSRDANFTQTNRTAFAAAANKYEASLVTLSTQATAAAANLSTLKDSSKQLHDAVQQAVTGSYSLSTAAATGSTSSSIVRNGIRLDTTTGGGSAASIAGYYAAGAQTAKAFAAALEQLADRGLSTGLLAELAQMGTEQGLPIAQALLKGTPDQIASLNTSFGAIAAAGSSAGGAVADATYADQIAAADANAKRITDELARQGEALRQLIAKAFGLKGYATGTASAAAGIRWVGEDGPELVGFAGGERVLNAQDSARWVRGTAGPTAQGGEQRIVVEFPRELALRDADGGFRGMIRTEARGVASQVVTERHDDLAIRLMGASA